MEGVDHIILIIVAHQPPITNRPSIFSELIHIYMQPSSQCVRWVRLGVASGNKFFICHPKPITLSAQKENTSRIDVSRTCISRCT
uniref:Uncharacterized protein n=1 Tax=Setaria italica TaxID=4555 RepID=K3Y0F6_SETIT